MTERELLPPRHHSRELADVTGAEPCELWGTCSATEEYLAPAPSVADEDCPPIGPPRTSITLHPRREIFLPMRRPAKLSGLPVDSPIDDLVTQASAATEARRPSPAT